ncbi:MAG: tetratricopeptide repeat protein [Burkholderiales bacterium]|nr:tetratricopeptide repeat protein [Burkholderiales bacterium]
MADGRVAQALAVADAAIERLPHDPSLAHVRGVVLMAWNRHVEALTSLRRAEACGGASVELFIDAGWCSYMLGDLAQAEGFHSKAVAMSPDSPDAHFALGVVRKGKGDFDAAMLCFDRVRVVSPAYPDCALNMAMCERGSGNQEAAENWLRRSLKDSERDPRAWCLLGMVLMAQERHDEAFDCFGRARDLEIETGIDARSLAQHVASLLSLGRAAEAGAMCETRLAGEPDPSAHAHYAFALLTTGRFREGWQQYDYRWFEEPMRSARAAYPRPVWAEQSLAGKTILLRAEQGFGDIIQFARYATPLKGLGATVLMQVHDGIVELAQHFTGVDRVLPKGEVFTKFDYYIGMLSLPRAFATEESTVPSNVPYIHADPSRVARWAVRIREIEGLKVGLAWAGNPGHKRDRDRSIRLEKLAPLWQIAGVKYVSLQKVLRLGDAEIVREVPTMLNLGPELADFADTAAVIDGLDLVICVDTAVAHLAGAMGKPVWLMIPTVADFRWMQDREDSPWYPTMRIFRQASKDDWDDVVRRVGESLRKVANGDGSVLRPPLSSDRPPEQMARETSNTPQPIALVTEGRDGILQYVQGLDAECRSIEWYGEYLTGQLEVLARVVPSDAHIVEIGSGIGAHALWFAKVLEPQAHLFLYEHRPIVRRILLQNLEANALAGRATLVRGTICGAGKGIQSGEELPAHTIDDLRLGRLDLLKVQLPELALEILSGAETTLWRLRPKLLIAAQDDRSLAKLSLHAKERGYRCWRLDGALFNPRNFNQRGDDIFNGGRWLGLVAIPEEVDVGTSLSDLRGV